MTARTERDPVPRRVRLSTTTMIPAPAADSSNTNSRSVLCLLGALNGHDARVPDRLHLDKQPTACATLALRIHCHQATVALGITGRHAGGGVGFRQLQCQCAPRRKARLRESGLGGFQAPFAPAMVYRLLLSALTRSDRVTWD